MARMERGFGVAATVPVDVLRQLAVAAEAANYRTFWVNNPGEIDSIALLAAVAGATSTIRLGVGVVPVDTISPDRILASLRATRLDQSRLTLGIGSSKRPDPVGRVRQAGEQLRAQTGATVVVGALGPRMLAMAGEATDGVLLNWLTPAYVGPSAEIALAAALGADRPRPRIDGYVRCALGPDGLTKLQAEGDRYNAIPSYHAHFLRMQARPLDTAVAGLTPEAIARGLEAYDDVLDEVVVRAIVADESLDGYLALLQAGAPA